MLYKWRVRTEEYITLSKKYIKRNRDETTPIIFSLFTIILSWMEWTDW